MEIFAAFFTLLATLMCTTTAGPVWKSAFECPPADRIQPCTCSNGPKKIVRCEDVKDLDIVRKALENRFHGPLPWLEITNVHSLQLPHHAFNNISAKRLVLNGSNIRRIHDDAFDGQDSLGLLVLSEDRLTEFPTESLKRLPGLRTLSLTGNFLMRLTDESIGNDNSHLKFLILSDNRLSHVSRNSFPTGLESLSLSKNLLTTLNGSLKNLDKLEIFFGSNNRLASVEGEFEGLSQLRLLSLEGNDLFDIEGSFEDQSNLRSLNLAYNSLHDVEEGLYPLKNLRNLNLSYNYITDIEDDLFKSLSAIETLDLSGNYLQDMCQSLKHAHGLKELHASNTNLKSLDFECFKGMRNLQLLDLSQNYLSNIDALTGHFFPKLLFLHIQSNNLKTFRYGLKNLKSLYELDIRDNRLSTIKAHHLAHNTQLKTLMIEGNPWGCSSHLLNLFRDLKLRMVQLVGAPLCYQDENAL